MVSHDCDVASGDGTGGQWRTVAVHVYCGVDEQLVSRDTRQKRKILKRTCPLKAKTTKNESRSSRANLAAMKEDRIKAAAMAKQSFEDHDPQLCLASQESHW